MSSDGEIDLVAFAGLVDTIDGATWTVDPAARHIAQPHFVTHTQPAAKRHAAEALANLPR